MNKFSQRRFFFFLYLDAARFKRFATAVPTGGPSVIWKFQRDLSTFTSSDLTV